MKLLNTMTADEQPLEKKYKVLVEAIEKEETVKDKVDGIATLLFMLINNDLSCSEKRQRGIIKKLNMIFFLVIALFFLFVVFNPESLELIFKIIKYVF